jgi:hypothetical protein
MAHLPALFVRLALLVVTAKLSLKKKAQVVGT